MILILVSHIYLYKNSVTVPFCTRRKKTGLVTKKKLKKKKNNGYVSGDSTPIFRSIHYKLSSTELTAWLHVSHTVYVSRDTHASVVAIVSLGNQHTIK